MASWFGSRLMSRRSPGTSLDASLEISSDMCFSYRQGPQIALVTGLSELMRLPSATPRRSEVALDQAKKDWAHDAGSGQPCVEVLPSFQVPCVWSPQGGCFGGPKLPEAIRVREDILCGRRSPAGRARASPAPDASETSAHALAHGSARAMAESDVSPKTCGALWSPETISDEGKGSLEEQLAIAIDVSSKQAADADAVYTRW